MSSRLASPAEHDSGLALQAEQVPQGALNWAAVSFLFEDAVWCDWLYREFDGERVPRPLIKRPSRFGIPYPDRISVTPDPADPTQLENYAETLQAAQQLVLVVSPASGQSPMLQEHLRIFKAAGGEERIVALVVKGDPGSPSADPGADSDREWLPPWLTWRFENNQFRDAGPTEPLVVDARLGIASLAEARARIMAALLEVERAALTELGIVTRPTTNLMELPVGHRAPGIPAPTPSTATFVEIAEGETIREAHSNLPLWICGVAALAALGFLACWPDPLQHDASRARQTLPVKRVQTPGLPIDMPLVEARPILDAAIPELSQPIPAPAAAPANGTQVAQLPVTNTPPQGTATIISQPPASAPKAPISQLVPVTSTARLESATRRDRFTRLAEAQMAEGNSREALDLLENAMDVSREMVGSTSATAGDSLDFAFLARRAGTLAEGLGLPAVARKHYETGRKALADLRTKTSLSLEGMRLLGEFDSLLRQLRS
jgi:hypothetical protein